MSKFLCRHFTTIINWDRRFYWWHYDNTMINKDFILWLKEFMMVSQVLNLQLNIWYFWIFVEQRWYNMLLYTRFTSAGRFWRLICILSRSRGLWLLHKRSWFRIWICICRTFGYKVKSLDWMDRPQWKILKVKMNKHHLQV